MDRTMMLSSVLGIVLCVGYISAQNQENIDRCPTNLMRGRYLHSHGDFCYEFSLSKHKYWRSAKEYCTKNGGSLVKIENMDQELFLLSTLTHLGFHEKAIWIGLNDIDHEGTYRWADGEVAAFTYWAPGEPGFTHNFDDCVAMKVSNSGHWYDYQCELPFFDDFSWICQYDMLPQPTADPGLIIGELQTTSSLSDQSTTPDSDNLVGK